MLGKKGVMGKKKTRSQRQKDKTISNPAWKKKTRPRMTRKEGQDRKRKTRKRQLPVFKGKKKKTYLMTSEKRSRRNREKKKERWKSINFAPA